MVLPIEIERPIDLRIPVTSKESKEIISALINLGEEGLFIEQYRIVSDTDESLTIPSPDAPQA